MYNRIILSIIGGFYCWHSIIGLPKVEHNSPMPNGGLICKPAKPDSHAKRKIPAFRDSSYACHC